MYPSRRVNLSDLDLDFDAMNRYRIFENVMCTVRKITVQCVQI